MKMYPKIILKPNRAKNVSNGHPWVFSKAILSCEKMEDGSLCEVWANEKFIGIGFYHSQTDIAIRILTREQEEITEEFFYKKFCVLRDLKKQYIGDTNAYRAVFAESDGIPGLVVDIYNEVLVSQIHILAIERHWNIILPALLRTFSPKGIYLKLSKKSARREGVKMEEGILFGDVPQDVEIKENGMKFLVNIVEGQKTGFFLDQRENRQSMIRYAKDKKVLNCFSYTGGFSVATAMSAKSVASLDISELATEYAKKNFEINGLRGENYTFITDDAFDFLRKLKKDEYDCIILDPPSMARDKSQVRNAIKAYVTINSEVLKALPKGGILATASCTAHIDEELFLKILYQSAVNASCDLRVLHRGNQPFDHGQSILFPEGKYLKFYIFIKE